MFNRSTSTLRLFLCLFALHIAALAAFAQNPKRPVPVSPITKNVNGIKKWMQAFDLVNARMLHQPNKTLPTMVFFDDSLMYVPFSAPGDTLRQALEWNIQPHGGALRLPDGKQYRVAMMSFAAEDQARRPFFVMAAPSYWALKRVRSPELGVDNLLTAVFIHEYTHLFQFDGFGAKINAIAPDPLFKKYPLTDDVVQDVFATDSVYARMMQREIAEFYRGCIARTDSLALAHAKRGIEVMHARQQKYHVDSMVVLTTAEQLFLSMEGMGQWTALQWLKHPKGAKLNYNMAVDGIRRKRNKWTQEEGLALFMLLERFGGYSWIPTMFSNNPPNIVELLEAAIEKRQAASTGLSIR